MQGIAKLAQINTRERDWHTACDVKNANIPWRELRTAVQVGVETCSAPSVRARPCEKTTKDLTIYLTKANSDAAEGNHWWRDLRPPGLTSVEYLQLMPPMTTTDQRGMGTCRQGNMTSHQAFNTWDEYV